MKYLILIIFSITSIFAFESNIYYKDVQEKIECDNLKIRTIKDEKNLNYQKCLVYKDIFNKYKDDLVKWNASNKMNKKHTSKKTTTDLWASMLTDKEILKIKKEAIKNKKYNMKDIDIKKKEWEISALEIVYNSIYIEGPKINKKYYKKIENWIKENNFSNFELDGYYDTQKISVQKGIWRKNQYQINNSFTSLMAIYDELKKRGIQREIPIWK